MNSQNFLVIFCLFPIFWGLSVVAAKPAGQKLNLFNYDDEVDVFQTHNEQQLGKQNAAKKAGLQPKHKSLSPGDHDDHEAPDMFLYTDYEEPLELDTGHSMESELHSYPKPLGKHPLDDSNPEFKMSDEDDTNISIRKWNWMEWILRQQPKRQVHAKSS